MMVFLLPNNTIADTIDAIPKQKKISPYCSGGITEARKNQNNAVALVPIISENPIAVKPLKLIYIIKI